jgi:hypothetical protein
MTTLKARQYYELINQNNPQPIKAHTFVSQRRNYSKGRTYGLQGTNGSGSNDLRESKRSFSPQHRNLF